MTLRNGMSDLVRRLRQLSEAAADEYTLDGETYWSDDHLQDILDRCRSDIYEETMSPVIQFQSGASVYRDYYFTRANVERVASGSAAWQLQDVNGSAVSTANYTVDYNTRLIQFGTSTDGGDYYLNYRAYDMNRAAAEVWRTKAANVAGRFDVKTDNHDLKRSQLRKHYLEMAEYFEQQAMRENGGAGSGSVGVKSFYRVDLYG